MTPDAALEAAARPWMARDHTTDDEALAAALRAWLAWWDSGITDGLRRAGLDDLSADEVRELAQMLRGHRVQRVSEDAGVLHSEHHPGTFVPTLDSCPEHERADYEAMVRRSP
jgi:hypothetical protein